MGKLKVRFFSEGVRPLLKMSNFVRAFQNFEKKKQLEKKQPRAGNPHENSCTPNGAPACSRCDAIFSRGSKSGKMCLEAAYPPG